MTVADSFGSFARKVDKISRELTDESMLRSVGMAGKRIGTEAVTRDIGDLSMSNWRRGRPINLGARFDVLGDNSVEVSPRRGGRGPMRVLNDGRKPGVSRRGRPVSGSRGKGTWSDATQAMERELPKVAHQHVTKVLRRHF